MLESGRCGHTSDYSGNVQRCSHHHQAGELARAESLNRQILAQNPQHADAMSMLGMLLLAICADTSVAHLCGTLGKPTWVPMREPTEWRWLPGREGTPCSRNAE